MNMLSDWIVWKYTYIVRVWTGLISLMKWSVIGRFWRQWGTFEFHWCRSFPDQTYRTTLLLFFVILCALHLEIFNSICLMGMIRASLYCTCHFNWDASTAVSDVDNYIIIRKILFSTYEYFVYSYVGGKFKHTHAENTIFLRLLTSGKRHRQVQGEY